MSPVTKCNESPWIGFPRVSGDEPQIKTIIGAAKTFSPRERG